MDIEAIELLKKRIDDLEGKAVFHKRKMEDCEAEIWRTQLTIDRLKKDQSTVTDFKTAKELSEEQKCK
jgi:uncharacterized coiled-coil protein SlyX